MHGDRGAISIVVAIVAAALVTAGAGVGVALDQAEVFGSHGDPAVVQVDAVDVVVCPDGAVSGRLHRGDRVYATGRDRSGEWIEIRNPSSLSQRVWIRTVYLVPDDGGLNGLDVHPCDTSASTPTSTSTTTTTTAPAPDAPSTTTTSTTRPGSTPTTPPNPGGGGTTPPPPLDTTGPTISGAGVSPNPIWEQTSPGKCLLLSTYPVTATVSVSVSDPSGVQSVTMSWGGPEPGSKTMSGGGTYSAVIGPFSPSLLTSTQGQITITISITATDSAGNSRTNGQAATIAVNDCTFL